MTGPRIQLIHAVTAAQDPIHGAFARLWPEARTDDLTDASLPADREQAGSLTDAFTGRMAALIGKGVDGGADAVLFTCSAFGAAIERARENVDIPVLKPGEAMIEMALSMGPRIGGLATFTAPVANFAKVPGSGKLVFVLLRGGFDGLAALVPTGDRDYQSIRGRMAYAAADLIPLNDGFALAPGLSPLADFWARGELVALQAMAIPYRTRSHFDGQAVLGHVFNALVVDGGFGLIAKDGATSVDMVTISTDDPAYIGVEGQTSTAVNTVETYVMDQPTAIPDRGVLSSTIEITDSFSILDLDIQLNITHSRDSDLRVALISPDGTRIELFDGIGGENLTDTVFDDDAALSILDGAAPYTGSFRPLGDLSLLEGASVSGTWTLEIADQARRMTGTLNIWSLTVTSGSAMRASSEPGQTMTAPELLTEAELAPIVEYAIQYWLEAGLIDAGRAAALGTLNVEITDLAGLTLAIANDGAMLIDANAAGYGWFVDATPSDNSEFALRLDDGSLTAASDGPAAGLIDLLSVVIHEIGHVIGLTHGDAVLTDSTLDAGERLMDENPGVG